MIQGVHSSRGFMLSLLINCDVHGLICALACQEPVSVFPRMWGKVIWAEETDPSCTDKSNNSRCNNTSKDMWCFVFLRFGHFRLHIALNGKNEHVWTLIVSCGHCFCTDRMYSLCCVCIAFQTCSRLKVLLCPWADNNTLFDANSSTFEHIS